MGPKQLCFFNLSQTGSPVSVVIDWFIVPESAQIMCSLTMSFIIYTLLCQAPNGSAENKQWSLCVFDDVIEHTGSASFKYQEYFLQPMMNYVVDGIADVRQAACYGCGMMAQFGGEEYINACAEVVPLLFQVINAQDSRDRKSVV